MSDSYIEKALLKIARQINAFDEASMMSLWEKYAEQVRQFEPTKRWEESVVIFNIIQSTRLKNQLFNYNWAQSRMPGDEPSDLDLAALTAPEPRSTEVEPELEPEAEKKSRRERKAKVLTLTPKKDK